MKFKNLIPGLALYFLVMPAHAIDSIHLSDVIKSNGQGNINLLKDMTPAELELFRQENNGSLIFAIDVNEAANGSEKASTQAITVKSIQLQLSVDQNEINYSQFSTRTTALLTETGEVTRKEYYTLLGEAGSNRSSSNNQIQSQFDSTLAVPVDISLENVSSATLIVELLETNTSLGDPEAFYDFSNGFEDIALINAQDAAFIDTYRAGVKEAPLVISENPSINTLAGWIHYPSSDAFYIVAYEDLFPSLGDYDFNDLTVAYQVSLGLNEEGNISEVSGEAYLLTRGAQYDHDWYLNISLPETASGRVNIRLQGVTDNKSNTSSFTFNGNLMVKGFNHTLSLFTDPKNIMVNTFAQTDFILSPRFSFNAQLDQPLSPDTIANPPFDPFIQVHDTGYEIHLTDQVPLSNSKNIADGLTEFRDENGYPFAMLLPSDWKPPYAGIDIKHAYPEFTEFVKSQGVLKQQWYLAPNSSDVLQMPANQWRW